jgi:hypothetical protein
MLAGALLIAVPVIWFKVKDTVFLEDDLKFSDETIEDVAPADQLAAEKAAYRDVTEA